MNKALNAIKRFAADEEGVAMTEYAILLGILAVAIITTIGLLGSQINNKFAAACKAINNNTAC